MKIYLASSKYINFEDPSILVLAKSLAKDCVHENEIVKKCFEYVRDEIKHSADFKLNPITCTASEVLFYKTGYCYAKSHLLAALLRANNIPAGLCYQRLSVGDHGDAPYCLHGLNAVYLKEHGWYRLDARGNKAGVNAQFTPPQEQLAFAIQSENERDLPEIWAEPLTIVIYVLQHYKTYDQVLNHLPDIKLIEQNFSRNQD